MAIKTLLIIFCFLPLTFLAQQTEENKAIKIEFLQSLNKLETAFQKEGDEVNVQKKTVILLMDREIEKNSKLTEQTMKMPQRTPEERKNLQDQLAMTAKQKYLRNSFVELDWEGPKMDKSMALQVVRNFMEILQ